MATKKSTKNESVNYSVVTYQTKKGGTAAYVAGFESKEAAEALAKNMAKSVSASWRYNDKQEKVYILSVGTRYVGVAKDLCAALNNGDKKAVEKACVESVDIYNAVKGENAKKQKDTKPAEEPRYTMSEIAAMMKRAVAGEKVPELAPVKKAMGFGEAA